MKTRAYRLMKEWCDTLLTYKVSSPHADIDGALLCPACHTVHGRIADLALPMTLLYVTEGKREYLDFADKCIAWSERCLMRPDGSWRNDAISEWKGISAFFAISIGESLMLFGDKLPREIYERWLSAFTHLTSFIYERFFTITSPVINYFAGCACHLALASKLLGDEKYRKRAKQLEAHCKLHFDEDGLFFGEGKNTMDKSPHGCRYIDMGYNLEESLPLLIKYTEITGCEKDFYRERMRDHLAFVLPDGAIDNSFGIRHPKWTYWGSRTSDGLIEGLAPLCDDGVFDAYADLVLSAYERYTKDGLLSLPMATDAGEPTCIHHTFTHAKALASFIIDYKGTAEPSAVPEANGIKLYQSGNLALISVHGWRATVSAIDTCRYDGAENSGGSMTLLYKSGKPRIASTMRKYTPVEPHNMQFLRHSDQTGCMTPRVELEGGKSNLTLYRTVTLTKKNDGTVVACGEGFEIEYAFANKLTVTVRTSKPARFVFPLIKWGEPIVCDGAVTIDGIRVEADGIEADTGAYFNQVGGFIWVPLYIPVDKEATVVISDTNEL